MLGLIGVVLLVDPIALVQNYSVNVWATVMVFLGALGWSAGSIYGRDADLPANPFMSTAMQMFAGGLLLILVGLLLGEGQHVDVAALSLRSFFAWSYLLVFGSFIAFSAYVWLLKNASPALASTYAYVNPVVAVFLGWALAAEPLNLRIFIAITLLISGVVLITRYSRRPKQKHTPKPAPIRPHLPEHIPQPDREARPHPAEHVALPEMISE